MSTPSNRAAVVLSLLFGTFMTPFMGSSLNIALPDMAQSLHVDAVTLTWVSTIFILASGISLIPMGRLIDTLGRARLFKVGMIAVVVSTTAVTFAPDILTLLVFRAIQGVATSLLFASTMPIMMGLYPPQQRGMVLGWITGVVYTGLALGPVLGGLLTQAGGWRAVTGFTIPIALVALALSLKNLPKDPPVEHRPSIDIAGSLLYALALSGLILSLSFMPRPLGFVLLTAGTIFLIWFVRYEWRAPQPVLDMRLFAKNRPFALANAAALVNYAATFTVGFLLSLYLQYTKGLSPREAGLTLIAQPILQASLSPWAGRLSDRVDPRYPTTIGMILTALCLGAFALVLDAQTPIPLILGILGVLGVSFALFSSPNTNAVMGAVPKHQQGVASGTIGTMRLTGQMLSMGLASLMIALHVGPHKVTPELIPEFLDAIHGAFAIFAVLCLTGVGATLARGK